MKKRDEDIASLIRKMAAKKSASSSPSVPSTDATAHGSSEVNGPITSTDASRISGENGPLIASIEAQQHEGSGSTPASSPPMLPPPPYSSDHLPQDPADRLPIASYPINDQDVIRRAYIMKGPKNLVHKHLLKGKLALEIGHSISGGGHKSPFTNNGWRNWNRDDALDRHVGKLTTFDEVNMELLSCMTALNPSNYFASFDSIKVRRLAEFYPNDISSSNLIRLEMQLDNYIDDMRREESFQGLNNLVQPSVKLVETKRDIVYDLVYLLIKLTFILPVATASVERAFSAMNFVKNDMRNRMSDSLLDDCLVTFIEK
ncbi:hypothetical protein EJB05_11953, partial [Eragrostis curvula]